MTDRRSQDHDDERVDRPSAEILALRQLYEALDRELQAIRPVCELSGRCCRFAEYGHSLFVTDLELQELFLRHGPPNEPIGETCPYQSSTGTCEAREGRPLGCRVYFCDPTYQSVMPELTEQHHRQLVALHERERVPYRYGEFLVMLASNSST